MLRPIDPTDIPPPPAYRVPWRIVRTDPAHPVVSNDSAESADFVRVFRSDPGECSTQWWGQMLPTENMELCLCTADLDQVVVTIAWFRPSDGQEYVWKFVG
ncbi:hypothetical protein [Microbacterium sp. GXF6406]